VHWRLLTTRAVGTVADALEVAEAYAKRWKIEEVFRTMKRKGFDVEGLRIGEEAPRNRLIFACLLAATVVMQMTAEREGGSGGRALRPLTDAFDPGDRPLLEAVGRDLEGYYGKPGPVVILRGWTEFQSLKHGGLSDSHKVGVFLLDLEGRGMPGGRLARPDLSTDKSGGTMERDVLLRQEPK
jgi:hypothetical protein